MPGLHKAFEKSVSLSEHHIKVGTTQNEKCDSTYKALLEEAQVR